MSRSSDMTLLYLSARSHTLSDETTLSSEDILFLKESISIERHCLDVIVLTSGGGLAMSRLQATR